MDNKYAETGSGTGTLQFKQWHPKLENRESSVTSQFFCWTIQKMSIFQSRKSQFLLKNKSIHSQFKERHYSKFRQFSARLFEKSIIRMQKPFMESYTYHFD